MRWPPALPSTDPALPPPARMWRRGGAAVFDLAVVLVLAVGAASISGGQVIVGTEGVRAEGAACLVLFLAPALWLVPESLGGATLGKLVFGLRIVPLGGPDELTLGRLFRRDLLKALDALLFHIGGTIAALSNPLRQTTADRWASTMVVEASRYEAWRGVGSSEDFDAWLATMKSPAPGRREEAPVAPPPPAEPSDPGGPPS